MARPAVLVVVQVVHHGLAEGAGLREATPLLKQWLHDVGDEAYLYGGDRVSLLIAQGADLQVKFLLNVTLPVEFLTHSLTPLSAEIPRPTRVTHICTLQSDLQDKVSVRCLLEIQALVVQVLSEGGQELILSADVCGQDEGAQLLFHVLPHAERQV